MDWSKVTKSEFDAYRKVQHSGYYNAFTEGKYAANAAGISMDVYEVILFNYSKLENKFGPYRPEPLKEIKIQRPSKMNPEPARKIEDVHDAYWCIFESKPNSPEARLRDWRLRTTLCGSEQEANDVLTNLMEQVSGKYCVTRKERIEWKLVKLSTEVLCHKAMENRVEVAL